MHPLGYVPLILLSTSFILTGAEKDLGRKVWTSPIAEHTWRIRSISPVPGFGDVESNAVLVAGPRESVLIDTPATVEQTAIVLDWAEKEFQHPVRHLIATHWHADRLGGIDAAAGRGINTYASDNTIALATQNVRTAPEHVLRSGERMTLSGVELESYYPGHGHTIDNIVVWIPRDKVLDAGCFSKSADSQNLGNTQEIDITKWSQAVALVRRRYHSAVFVVPGHGAIGGAELLDHTADLLNKAVLTFHPMETHQ